MREWSHFYSAMGFILGYFVFVLISVKFIKGECNAFFGPAGSQECVLVAPYYNKYQWATCVTDKYMQTFSKGKHHCRDRFVTKCWYQCMLEIHELDKGPVYDDCACGSDAPTGRTTQSTALTSAIPDWCFSPSGTECNWYRQCLEKRYPCKKTGNSYALDYAEKFCNLYQEHYLQFDYIGQQWVDGVRKCLQVSLVQILRPFVSKTCDEIKQMAFDSHPGCYLNPSEGKPSICDIGVKNWARVFWTVKSAVVQAPMGTFKQMVQVMEACGVEVLIDGMQLIKLTIVWVIDKIKEILYNFIEHVRNVLRSILKWNEKEILYFLYPIEEPPLRYKRKTDNKTDDRSSYINILLAEASKFDLNAKNNYTVNLTAAAIDVARAVEKGDVRLDIEGVQFTELSVCVDYNCTETYLQVKPAPQPEKYEEDGLNVTALVIGICAGAFGIVLIVSLVVILRKTKKC